MTGAVKGEALIGNALMGVVGIFLVIAAIILGYDGIKAFISYRTKRMEMATNTQS
jgi:hypothetical protein